MKWNEIKETRKIKSYTFYDRYETNSGSIMDVYMCGNKFIMIREGVKLYITDCYIEIYIS
jgi:hypothetical protein